jgi:hypothetical protein
MKMSDGVFILDSIWFTHDQNMYDSAKRNMQQGAITFRYTENVGVFLLQSWQLNGDIFDSTDESNGGPVANIPDWLRLILDIAALGDYIVVPPYPPPEKILWFTTDKDHNLLNFNNDYGQFLIEESTK